MIGPASVARPPTAVQITTSMELAGRELARIDDADLRHVEGAGDAGHAGGDDEGEELYPLDAVAEEAGAALRVAHGDEHLAVFGADDRRRDEDGERQRQRRGCEKRGARFRRLHRIAEDVLEVGEPVIAAETHVVAEEGEQQRVSERLRDDGEIDAGHAASGRRTSRTRRRAARAPGAPSGRRTRSG